MIDAAEKAKSAETEAESAKAIAYKVVDELAGIRKDTLALTSDLKQQKLDVDKVLGGNFEKIANNIVSNDEFRSKLVKVGQNEIDQLRIKIDDLPSSYSISFQGEPHIVTPKNNASSGLNDLKCPPGEALTEIDLTLGGTCRDQCAADGRPIQIGGISGKCQKLGLSAGEGMGVSK